MGEFNSDDHYIYYCGQESLRRNGVALMVNKRVPNAVLGCNLKKHRMISVHFQGKPFNITVQKHQFFSAQLSFFPSVSLSHQEASISLLSFSIRGQTE